MMNYTKPSCNRKKGYGVLECLSLELTAKGLEEQKSCTALRSPVRAAACTSISDCFEFLILCLLALPWKNFPQMLFCFEKQVFKAYDTSAVWLII